MAETKTTVTFPHQDLINDNKVNVSELPQKVQDKIAKFSSLTEKESQEAMDESIYGSVEDFLEAKAKAEKANKTKANIAEHKKKKAGIDVSSANTAKTPEELAKEEEAARKAADAAKPRTVFNAIYPGRK